MLGAALLLAGDDSYPITNSIRLNGTSDYLSRTFTTGSTTKATISTWVKRAKLGATQVIFGDPANGQTIYFTTGDVLSFIVDATSSIATTAVYRDPSAWLHIVLQIDTTQSTASDRVKLWVNGTLTTLSGSFPGTTTTVNASGTKYIGWYASSQYHSGYVSEFVWVDGQALTPSSFGKTDSNGVWVPTKYAGTYGTNGFKLEFKNSAALGTDTSGNGNNWTVNGSPVQTIDTPTNNYATLNAIRPSTSTLTAGNTTAAGTASGTIPASQSDMWYWEVTANAVGVQAGLENTGGTTYTQSVSNGTTTGFGYTHSTTTLEYTTNGSSWNTVSSAVSGVAFPYVTGASSTSNFGATALAYTPPAGAKALCTANMASAAVTTSGTFDGNVSADGPFIWANGNHTTLDINGNAVTFGTHADKTAGGFKLRTSSASYNTSGSNTWTATAGKRFVSTNGTPNTAQGNP